MKISSVASNSRRRAFLVDLAGTVYPFPFVRCQPRPSTADPIVSVVVDSELADEGFTYVLKSGVEGSVHADQVLDYNKDPSFLRDMLVYKLTIEVRNRVATTGLANRGRWQRLCPGLT